MRLIEDETGFRRIFLKARTCVFIDSGRLPTTLHRYVFSDCELCTFYFADLVQSLIKHSGDTVANYIVLEPDPVEYQRLFKVYPALEIKHGDSSEEYIKALNENHGGTPAGQIGSGYFEYVIVPPSIKWFVHALQSSEDNSGHLWIPREWADGLLKAHPKTFWEEPQS